MTPEQIALVQSSFRLVLPIREQAAALFYERLLATDESARPLFADSDLASQGQKLMAALALVVNGLTKPETIVPVAQEMARRHVGYGVTKEQYASVGAALLWTLGQGLGDAFTPEVADGWAAAYGLLSGVMVEAAYAA